MPSPDTVKTNAKFRWHLYQTYLRDHEDCRGEAPLAAHHARAPGAQHAGPGPVGGPECGLTPVLSSVQFN